MTREHADELANLLRGRTLSRFRTLGYGSRDHISLDPEVVIVADAYFDGARILVFCLAEDGAPQNVCLFNVDQIQLLLETSQVVTRIGDSSVGLCFTWSLL